MITHYETNCPHCNKTNYYSNGDETDLTIEDAEALQCWNCDFEWILEGCDWTDLENANMVKGKQKEEDGSLDA